MSMEGQDRPVHEERFDEELLSGYLDGVLVQQDEQRVRVRLESSSEARELLAQLREIREAAMSTSFTKQPDVQWSEKPRGGVSRWTRGLGFLLFLAWAVGIVGYGLWSVATGPESLFGKLAVFGLVSGIVLLLLSVLLDRLKVAKSDPYRGVVK